MGIGWGMLGLTTEVGDAKAGAPAQRMVEHGQRLERRHMAHVPAQGRFRGGRMRGGQCVR